MGIRILILIGLVLVLSGGCKLVVQVPKGGSVISQSGAHNCAEGKTCRIEIVDLFFEDTFTAKPAAGYAFKHWKKKERGFCANNTAPCQLSSAPLGINDLLLALLESDEVFYLQPVFVSTAGGGGGGAAGKQNSSVCFNRSILTPGNTFTVRYKSTDKTSGATTDSTITQTNVGQRSFKGTPATLARSTISIKSENAVTRADNYFVAEIAKKRSINLGGTAQTFINGVLSATAETVFDPGQLTRYDLAAGQSFTQTNKVRTKTSAGGFNFNDTQTLKVTTTYVGTVTVTVPAGSYRACEYTETTTAMIQGFPFNSSRRYWYGVGIGLQIKEESQDHTTVLVAGSIDGKKI